MRLKLLLPIIAAAGLIAAAAAIAAPEDKVEMSAKMSGKQEVPGPGDKDGKGTAELKVNAVKQKVCFTIEYEGLSGTATAGHIHKGAKGDDGNIVVELFTTEQESPGRGLRQGREGADAEEDRQEPGGLLRQRPRRRVPRGRDSRPAQGDGTAAVATGSRWRPGASCARPHAAAVATHGGPRGTVQGR